MRKNSLQEVMFVLLFRPLVWIILGLTIQHRSRLPVKGPAIIIANHNSHMDTILLMSLYPLRSLFQVRPVAAADYFLKNRYIAWFCKRILQIIPIQRIVPKKKINPLQTAEEALQQGSILIFYPEGTRGVPERMEVFKKGIVRLAARYPDVPIIPVYLQGLGKVLPKGRSLLVPFNVQAVIGNPVQRHGNMQDFGVFLHEQIKSLAEEIKHA